MEAVSKLKETDETRLAFFSIDFKVLHRRLMHAGVERTLKAADQAGIRLSNKPNKRFHCESCELAKSHQIISREPQTPAERPFQRVHFDLIEYKKGWGDKKWAIHFQDAYSNYQWVRMLASALTHGTQSVGLMITMPLSLFIVPAATCLLSRNCRRIPPHHGSKKFLQLTHGRPILK